MVAYEGFATPLFVGLTIRQAIQVYWQVLHSAKKLNAPASWHHQQPPLRADIVQLGCFFFEKSGQTCVLYAEQVLPIQPVCREIVGKAKLLTGVPLSQIAVELLKPVLQRELYALAGRDLSDEAFQVEVVDEENGQNISFPANSLVEAKTLVLGTVDFLKRTFVGTKVKTTFKTELGQFINSEFFEPSAEVKMIIQRGGEVIWTISEQRTAQMRLWWSAIMKSVSLGKSESFLFARQRYEVVRSPARPRDPEAMCLRKVVPGGNSSVHVFEAYESGVLKAWYDSLT